MTVWIPSRALKEILEALGPPGLLEKKERLGPPGLLAQKEIPEILEKKERLEVKVLDLLMSKF
jgi:hypothetical protein